MRILFLGDIVGQGALKVISTNLARLKKKYKADLVFANAENVSNGSGLKEKDYKVLMRSGIQGLTMGNHVLGKLDILSYGLKSNISFPANIPDFLYHKKYYQYNDKTICLINLLGRVFMHLKKKEIKNPFLVLEEILNDVKADYIIVDFHAEATSEKNALLYAFAGKVDAIVGTHTHVQTADECVLNKTLYITDLGKCGPVDSILGLEPREIVERFKTDTFSKATIALGDIELSGVLLDFDGRKITRFKEIYEVMNEKTENIYS